LWLTTWVPPPPSDGNARHVLGSLGGAVETRENSRKRAPATGRAQCGAPRELEGD
jgi:hypothetical protein